MIDLEFVYKVSLQKLHNFHRESDGLRKLVLLNNFVFKKLVSPQQEEQVDEPLEWSEEDIKKDEESWLDSCLNDLDEDEDGYIYVNMPSEYQSTVTSSFPINCYDDSRHYEDHYIQNNNSMDYEQQPHEHQLSKDGNIVEDVIIPHDLLHLPYFEPSGEGGPYHMDIEEEQVKSNNTSLNDTSPQHDYDVNMTEVDDYSDNLSCEKGFHPYWKDNSIISPSIYPLKKSSPFRPYFELNTRSFGIPKIFHKYRLGQDYSPYHIAPPFIRKLLQSDHSCQSFDTFHYDSPLKRSKDDLDILYSLAPRVIDKGALMDMISMLEYYGCKTNHNNIKESNSSETSDMWFLDNE